VTTYTKRDLRAVDLLAMVLFGVGIVLALIAVAKLTSSKGGGDTLLLWIGAVSSLSLGTALSLKVRQLVRNKGEEPKDYDGVPE